MLEIRKENLKSSPDFFKKVFLADYGISPASSSLRNFILLASILLFSAGLPFIVNSIEKYSNLSITGTVFIFLSIVFFYIYFNFKSISVKKHAEINYLNQGKSKFLMNEEGITAFNDTGGSIITKWTDMAGYYHKDDFILLYGKDRGFKYFDLNNYSDEEQKALMSWIKKNMPPVELVINTAALIEKEKQSGANAFIAPPDKYRTILIIIISIIFLGLIIASYFRNF